MIRFTHFKGRFTTFNPDVIGNNRSSNSASGSNSEASLNKGFQGLKVGPCLKKVRFLNSYLQSKKSNSASGLMSNSASGSISLMNVIFTPMKMRLNKYIAHTGLCSRRKAGDLVKAGKIVVNGKKEINPAIEVGSEDVVEHDGKVLRLERKKIYLLINKPKNVITTMQDDRGRKTIWDVVKEKVKGVKVFPVGRLDRNTTGLLLLTNDGDLAHKLSHPSSHVKKIYQVILDRPLSEEDILKIDDGVILEDGKAEIDEVSYIQELPPTHIGIQLHSGKNRIIRRIFEHLKYEVVALDRVYMAGLTKKDLPRGWSRHLKQKEIIMLRHFTNTKKGKKPKKKA